MMNRREFFNKAGIAFGAIPFWAGILPEHLAASIPSGIKITDVKTFIVERLVFVKIYTNVGVTGLGETSIATGEHNYNRWVFHDLMKAGAVDILNPAPEWCGGISEIIRICAMASAWGLQVSPHHMKQHVLAHLVASQPRSVCPYVEYRHCMYMGTSYFDKYPIAHNGNSQIELSDRPGFGVELDESKVVNMELIYSQS